jgi:hypothetical protein
MGKQRGFAIEAICRMHPGKPVGLCRTRQVLMVWMKMVNARGAMGAHVVAHVVVIATKFARRCSEFRPQSVSW